MTQRFVINERTWSEGGRRPFTHLLDADGFRCCLGFIASQCGIPDEVLQGVPELRRLPMEYWDKLPKELRPSQLNGARTREVDANLTEEAYSTNDDALFSLTQREQALQKLFGAKGIQLMFEDR